MWAGFLLSDDDKWVDVRGGGVRGGGGARGWATGCNKVMFFGRFSCCPLQGSLQRVI